MPVYLSIRCASREKHERGTHEDLKKSEEARTILDVQDLAVEERVELVEEVGVLEVVLDHESEEAVQREDPDRAACSRQLDARGRMQGGVPASALSTSQSITRFGSVMCGSTWRCRITNTRFDSASFNGSDRSASQQS